VTGRSRVVLVAFLANLVFVTATSAEPIVKYSVTGEPGNWLLDFSVTNTLGVEGLNIYFFGVQLPERDVFASPTDWSSHILEWRNAFYGGSSTLYNNNWTTRTNDPGPDIDMGATLSGFAARVRSMEEPTSVPWFAIAYGNGARYEGSDHFWLPEAPGFEGVASPTPEPAAVLLTATGFAIYLRRRYASAT